MEQEKTKRTGVELLTPLQVKSTKLGTHADGGGLLLRVQKRGDKTATGTGLRRSWFFRYASPTHRTTGVDPQGKPFDIGNRRDIGLGCADSISLAKVRSLAREYREQVRLGIDPLDTKRETAAEEQAAEKAKLEQVKAEEQRVSNTLRKFAAEVHKDHIC